MDDKKNTELKEFGHDVLNSLTRIVGHLSQSIRSDDLEHIKKKIQASLQAARECAEFCNQNMIKSDETSAIESYLLSTFFIQLQESYKKTFPDFDLQIQSVDVETSTLKTNPAMFRNAIQNITKNSIEAGANKMIIIWEDKKVCFIDNGPGISQANASQIKDKGTTKKDSKDHGLGLLSLSRFCSSNGWKLHFYNNTNKDFFPSGFTVEFIFE